MSELVERCDQLEAVAGAGHLSQASQAVREVEAAHVRARQALEAAQATCSPNRELADSFA